MTPITHHFARSRGLQLAALLAWLFLVVTPMFGMPGGMKGVMHDAGHATSMQMTDHGDHTPLADVDHPCCGSDDGGCADGHACNCSAACGTIAALPVIREFTSTRVAGAHSLPFHARVPGSDSTPPLRPPAA